MKSWMILLRIDSYLDGEAGNLIEMVVVGMGPASKWISS